MTFDYVVANPPFSDKKWITGLLPSADPYRRFEWGEPPNKQGDYAYLLHIVRSMNRTGVAACILPHGVLFRGNAEAVLRKRLVDSGKLPRHHRPARQSLLRHRHPGVHPRARQQQCGGQKSRVHDRRLEGLRQGRSEEQAPRAGRTPDRGHVSPAARGGALRPTGAGGGDQRREKRLQPQSPALHRHLRAGGSAGHQRPLRGGIPKRDVDALDEFWDGVAGRAGRAVRAEPLGGLRATAHRRRSRPLSWSTRSLWPFGKTSSGPSTPGALRNARRWRRLARATNRRR